MKTCDEMAGAVLVRAREEKAKQRLRRRKSVLAAACASFVCLAVLVGAKVDMQSAAVGSGTSRVSVFCVTASAAEQRQQMLIGEKLPYNAVIRVRDITGLGELEVQQLHMADKEYAKQMAGQNLNDVPGNPDWSRISRTTDKTMITTIFVGSFYLTVDDYKQIERVDATTTEIGYTAQHLADYYDETLKDGIGITWSLSEVGVDRIEQNPQMALSEITDTVTVTVTFKDGTKEVVVIEISVDDDGQIYGTFQGTDVIE